MRRGRGIDPTSLVAGLAVLAFGVVLLLHQVDALTLSFGAAAPIVFAVIGAILLASGVSRRA